MIIAYPVNPIRMPFGDAGIVFNKAAPVSGGDPLITTSPLSWTDTKSNTAEYGISFSKYAVVTHEALGRGDIYVIGDPNIFINSMQNIESGYANAQFINLLLSSHEMILVDTYSTRIEQPAGLWTIIHRIQTNIEYRLGFATLILLVILITWQKIII